MLDSRFGTGRKTARHSAIAVCLLACATATRAAEPAPRAADYLRDAYRQDAGKCRFSRADGTPLKLTEKPVMRWANDDDWSGDVFVWSDGELPAVIGCVLSGPFDPLRYVYHEFHLLADKPIAPADVQDGRRWEPATGLERKPLPSAPAPADSASGRLVQMRKIARSFTAQMEADGRWELRLLPQPLLRYGKEQGDVLDGALFCYVWTKGTDPELVLLLECRRDGGKPTWHYAPVLFTNRALWLKHEDREVWHADPHQEPAGKLATNIYTTAFARSMPAMKEADLPP